MAVVEYAVDMGTSHTAIFQKGVGLVLREPTVVVTGNGKDPIKFVGTEAAKLIGKTPIGMDVRYPVEEGLVKDADLAARMLNVLFKRIVTRHSHPKVKVLATFPCGCDVRQLELFQQAFYGAGVNEVLLLESPACTALGLDVAPSGGEPVLIVDIGGGKTDISVVTANGVITGCTLGLGGNQIDRAVADYLEGEFSFRVGIRNAERIKMQVGSLYVNENTSTVVNGSNAADGAPGSMEVTSKMIYDIMEHYYTKIIDVVQNVLNSLPADITADIKRRGVYVCGMGCMVAGLPKVMSKKLGLPILLAKEPGYCTVTGAGSLLSDRKLLQLLLDNRY